MDFLTPHSSPSMDWADLVLGQTGLLEFEEAERIGEAEADSARTEFIFSIHAVGTQYFRFRRSSSKKLTLEIAVAPSPASIRATTLSDLVHY